MSLKYGVEYKQSHIDEPATKIEPGLVNGKLSFLYFSLDNADQAVAVGDMVRLGMLPDNAKILGISAKGAAGQFRMGWFDGKENFELAVVAGAGGMLANGNYFDANSAANLIPATLLGELKLDMGLENPNVEGIVAVEVMTAPGATDVIEFGIVYSC